MYWSLCSFYQITNLGYILLLWDCPIKLFWMCNKSRNLQENPITYCFIKFFCFWGVKKISFLPLPLLPCMLFTSDFQSLPYTLSQSANEPPMSSSQAHASVASTCMFFYFIPAKLTGWLTQAVTLVVLYQCILTSRDFLYCCTLCLLSLFTSDVTVAREFEGASGTLGTFSIITYILQGLTSLHSNFRIC